MRFCPQEVGWGTSWRDVDGSAIRLTAHAGEASGDDAGAPWTRSQGQRQGAEGARNIPQERWDTFPDASQPAVTCHGRSGEAACTFAKEDYTRSEFSQLES